MNGKAPIRLLLLEDNPGDALLLRELLRDAEDQDFLVRHEMRLADAIASLGESEVDVALLDLSLPDSRGLCTIKDFTRAAPQVPVVVLTGLNDEDLGIRALRAGAQDYLVKGQTDTRLLVRALRYAIERRRILEQRHRAELALQRSEERFRVALQHSPITVANCDRQLRYTWLHNARFSVPLERVLGRRDDEIFDPDDARELIAFKEEVVNAEQSGRREVTLRVDGELRYYDISAEPLRDREGSVVGLTCSMLDITPRKVIEEQLRIARDRLAERVEEQSVDLEHAMVNLQVETRTRQQAEEALVESERRYRQLFENAPVGIGLATFQGRVVTANPAMQKLLAMDLEQLRDSPIRELGIDPADLQRAVETLRRTGSIRDVEVQISRRNGGGFYALLSADRARLAGQDLVLVLLQDITERRQAELVQRELAAVVESSTDGIFRLSVDGRIRSWNAGAELITSYTASEAIGRPFKELFPSNRVGEVEEAIARTARGEQARGFESDLTAREDRQVPVMLTLSPMLAPAGQTVGAAVVLRDISEHRRLENEVMQISEMERRRIGQDLHDTLGQILTGTAMLGGVLQRRLAEKQMPESEQASMIAEHLKESIMLTRSLARGLSPVEVEADGLMTALSELAAHAERMYGIQARFQCSGLVLVHDEKTAMHLYRIAQEAMTNAARHAQAKSVEITLAGHEGQIVLEVRDDGVGIRDEKDNNRGMGMHIMRYRAGAIGGSLSVIRGDSGGTSVTCVCPLSEIQKREEQV